jgi:hypothetical protein
MIDLAVAAVAGPVSSLRETGLRFGYALTAMSTRAITKALAQPFQMATDLFWLVPHGARRVAKARRADRRDDGMAFGCTHGGLLLSIHRRMVNDFTTVTARSPHGASRL